MLLPCGAEHDPYTGDTRREVDDVTQPDPRLFVDDSICLRVVADRPSGHRFADTVAWVRVFLHRSGRRLFLCANVFQWGYACQREQAAGKSLGVSMALEGRIEAEALRLPGGGVVSVCE